MKKKVLFSLCLAAASGALHAQVGVNNTDPKASLHITPQKTDGTTAEGIIAPNLTRAQLIGKDVRYTTAQKGAIVYVTAVDGTVTTKTTKITTVGYYYFDGALWQPFSQAEIIVPTEPWQVQGGTTAATSNAQNIYQTGSVGIGALTAVPAAYKLQVTGASNVTGNSRVGSSTVVGAQTVGTTLGVTGTSTLTGKVGVGRGPAGGNFMLAVEGNTHASGDLMVLGTTDSKATNMGGLLKYKPTADAVAVGQYLRASAVDGSVAWATLPAATVTTANNGLTMSGTTTQLGGALAKATTISGTAANTLTVSAPSIISGALRISSGTPAAGKFLTSDAAGNATWGTLPAAAVTTANNGLTMSGTTTQLGGALTKATTISGTAANTLTISAPSIISGALRISSGTPAAGKFLTSDAAGNATWGTLPAAAVTTANNGLTMSGTTTQLGGALTKATTISGTAANTLTVSAPSIISGALRISSGTPAAGKFLTSDAVGNATWGTLPVTATTEPWQVQGGAVAATTNAQNIYQTGSIGIGASTAVPAAYKLQVTGASNVTGNSRVGSSTVVGAQTVAGTSTLTGNVGIGVAPSTQKLYVKTAGTAVAPVPAVRITDGSQGFGKVLTSDADGIAHWEYARLRIVEGVKSTKAVTFPLKYDATVTTGNGIALQSGSSITLPPGRWTVAVKTLISIYDVSAKTNLTANDFAWVRSTFVDSPTVSGAIDQIKSVDIEGAYLISGRVSGPKPINKKNNACWGMMDGLIVINNSTNANKTYYYIVGAYDTASNYAQTVVELRVRVDGLESSITASSL